MDGTPPSPPEITALPKSSRLIGRVLSPAIQLWLRSQVDSVAELHVQIEGGDRQILSGYVPQVTVGCQKAIYRGLHLSQLALTGNNIRVNLGQVLKGKPLQLLEVVPVQGELRLHPEDLQASLQAPLLAQALQAVLQTLMAIDRAPEQPTPWSLAAERLHHPSALLKSLQIQLDDRRFTLAGEIHTAHEPPQGFALQTGLEVVDRQKLQLTHPLWLGHPSDEEGTPLPHLHAFQVDLGPEVDLQTLTIAPHALTCQGHINIIPLPQG